MTKPHEETWEYEARIGRVVAQVKDGDGSSLVQYRLDVAGSHDVGRLAAQAPAMARLLLAIETTGVKDGATMCCPVCNGGEPYAPPKHDRPTHEPGCEWVRVLIAAGVLPCP